MIKDIKLSIFIVLILFFVSCNNKSDNQTQSADANEQSWEWAEEKSNQPDSNQTKEIISATSTKLKQTNNYPVSINSKQTSIQGNKVDININLTITLDVNDLKSAKNITVSANTANTKSKVETKELAIVATKEKKAEVPESIKNIQKLQRDITQTVIPAISKKSEKKVPTKKEMPMKTDKMASSNDMKKTSNMGSMGGMNMSTSSNPQILNETLKSDGYQIKISSQKPLVVGDNDIEVTVIKDDKKITDAKVKVKFFMPEMPGMPYMEYNDKLKIKGDIYKGLINYSMGGTWQYQLKVKTSDDKVHKVRGSVNI